MGDAGGDGMSPLQNSITWDARKMQLVDNQIYGSETNRFLQRSRNFLKWISAIIQISKFLISGFGVRYYIMTRWFRGIWTDQPFSRMQPGFHRCAERTSFISRMQPDFHRHTLCADVLVSRRRVNRANLFDSNRNPRILLPDKGCRIKYSPLIILLFVTGTRVYSHPFSN